MDTAGQDWGESVEELTSSMKDADSAYGGDELGAALTEMYQAAGPTAITDFTETGFCVVETAIAMNQMADAYTVVERDNTAQAAKVQSIVDSLGDP